MRAPIRPILGTAVLSLAVALVALPTHAQQTPNAAPGIRAEAIYDVNGVDNVALMNGALSIRIPLGLSYPVNGGFSYQLALSYHSTLWDNRTDPCADPCQDYVRYEPKVTHNAGLGWRLSLGGLISIESYWNQSQHWIYVEPDGSEHVLYPTLHISDPEDSGDAGQVPALQSTLYSRDGSYIRARKLSSSRWRIEMPDGRASIFDRSGSAWRVTRLEDAFGNALTVSYTSDPEGPVWELDDGHRTHYVRFTDPPGTYPEAPPLLRSVELSRFRGGTATYSFTYATMTVNRPGLHNASAIPMETQVLRHIDLPSQGLYYEMGSEVAPTYNVNGLLTELRLPGVGYLDWEWENLVFPKIRRQPIGPLDEDPEPWRSVWGVKTRKERRGPNLTAAVWRYEREADRPDPIGPGPLPERWTVKVTDPNRDYTIHHFSIFPALDGLAIPQWGTKLEEYGLPYTRQHDDASFGGPGSPRFLSSESWDCNNAGNNCQKARSTYVRYELDDASPVDDKTGRIFNKNRRVVSRRTVYHDDPSGGTPRHRLESY
ncbi:MAG: hypothetical protein MI919_27355, partial [Holophagales bacterium]|nr:hypothetical protein [Holophagales bacterium]